MSKWQPIIEKKDIEPYSCREHLRLSNISFQSKNPFQNIFFLAVLGLHCCMRAFSSCGERGPLFVAVHGLLIEVASLVSGHGLQAHGLQQLWHTGSVVVARGLQSTGSVVVVHGLSCSAACGIFPDQGSNPCPLHWRRSLNHCVTREAPKYS